MKAAVLNQTGDIEHLQKNLVIEDIPLPKISAEEVLINMKSASLNHRDLWIAEGMYSKISLPVVLGSDGAGIVHNKGVKVKDFEIGDEVIINPGMNWGNDENFQSREFKILGMPDDGTLAEFVKVHQSCIYKKPSHLSFEQASAFPVAGVTAFRALFKKAEIIEHDNVLITGIGGGVASLALVFAIKAGANVFVTSGTDSKIQKAISLGVKAGVNYKSNDWDKKLIELSGNKINVVIDGTGGESFTKYLDILNYGSRIVSYGATLGSVPQFNLHRIYWKQIKLFGTTMGSPKDFAEMIDFINDKKVDPVIDQVFSLENVCEAFGKMDTGSQFGKIVVKI